MIYISRISDGDHTSVSLALTKYIGIGKEMSIQICDQLGCSRHVKCYQLSLSQLSLLKDILHQNYEWGSALQQSARKRKMRLSFISAYRGVRHLQGLPCRGQRTHGNARTSRKMRVATALQKDIRF